MKTIFKYPLRVTGRQIVSIHAGAEILSVQAQMEVPCIWALVDTDRSEEPMSIRIITTGQEVLESEKLERFIGTVQLEEGRFVIHVFKEK